MSKVNATSNLDVSKNSLSRIAAPETVQKSGWRAMQSLAVDFETADERTMAGLTAYYSRYNFFYLAVTAHSDGQRELLIMSSEASFLDAKLRFPAKAVQIPNTGKIKLALTICGSALQFFYALEIRTCSPSGPCLTLLFSRMMRRSTRQRQLHGAFVGVAAQDLNGLARFADFDYFIYRPVRQESDQSGV